MATFAVSSASATGVSASGIVLTSVRARLTASHTISARSIAAVRSRSEIFASKSIIYGFFGF
ncbi:MAG: hypothetical protein LBQ52_07475 [Helicobacteraceae bacterium]|nr:hypothetical protein [Helicobacteraceae bacterium]